MTTSYKLNRQNTLKQGSIPKKISKLKSPFSSTSIRNTCHQTISLITIGLTKLQSKDSLITTKSVKRQKLCTLRLKILQLSTSSNTSWIKKLRKTCIALQSGKDRLSKKETHQVLKKSRIYASQVHLPTSCSSSRTKSILQL